MLPYSTSAPRRDMWSIMRKMAFSLPGMIRELSTTVSPCSTEMCLWLSTDTRDSADMGSPWVPEINTTTFSGGKSATSCGRSRMPSGIVSSPSEWAISVTETMLRPTMATRRRFSCARSSTSCTR